LHNSLLHLLLKIGNFFNTDISQSSVATRLGCGRVFAYDFVTNFLPSLTVKEFWKSVNIWWSYGQELGVLFFWLLLYICVTYIRKWQYITDYIDILTACYISTCAISPVSNKSSLHSSKYITNLKKNRSMYKNSIEVEWASHNAPCQFARVFWYNIILCNSHNISLKFSQKTCTLYWHLLVSRGK